jgi:hypothetical protein
MRRTVLAVMVAVLVFGATGVKPVGGAESHAADEEMGPAESLGWGLGAVGTNLVYMPVKMIWALTGSFTALLAWGFSAGNDDVALSVLHPTLGGTWVVTPEMLRGKEPILFIGPSYESKAETTVAPPPPAREPAS